MLTRARIAATTVLSLGIAGAVGTAAPVASAVPTAPVSRTASASQAAPTARASAAVASAHLPAGAAQKLNHEMQQAWQITRGQGVTVAVLSTAVDPVTGLAGKLIKGPDYAPLAGASATDGTILASLIAGSGPTGTDPFGTIGRAPGAKILAEKVADFDSHGGDKYLADGTWQKIHDSLRDKLRRGQGRKTSPSAAIIDRANPAALKKKLMIAANWGAPFANAFATRVIPVAMS